MADVPTSIAADRLRRSSIVDRYERLDEEVRALRSDQKWDIMVEAKSAWLRREGSASPDCRPSQGCSGPGRDGDAVLRRWHKPRAGYALRIRLSVTQRLLARHAGTVAA